MNKYVYFLKIKNKKVLFIDFSIGMSEEEYIQALDEALYAIRNSNRHRVDIIVDMTETHTTLQVINHAVFRGKQVKEHLGNIVAINPSRRQLIFLTMFEHLTGKNITQTSSREEAIEQIRHPTISREVMVM